MELILRLAAVFYGAATLDIGLGISTGRDLHRNRVRGILLAGGVLHAIDIAERSLRLNHLAVSSFGESLSFLAFLLIVVFLVLQLRSSLVALAAIVAPLAFALVVSATFLRPGEEALPPALRSAWLPVHVTLAFLGDAVFAIASSASALYLIQERRLKARRGRGLLRSLPSLEALDRVNFNCLIWGLVLLTLGIVSGIVWAHAAWDRYAWANDPKLVFSLVVWVNYVVLLQGRMTAGWRGRWAAQLTIAGFAVILISLVGVNALGLGEHGRVF